MKTLILNSTYEPMSFVDAKRAFKYLLLGKVEVLSIWEDSEYNTPLFPHPSTLRFTKHKKRKFNSNVFSRKSVVKRDNSSCQYCGLKLLPAEVTIDHIVPSSKGGLSTYTNCVVACKSCNSKKDSKTLEEANLSLLRKPINPAFTGIYHILQEPEDDWHEHWENFLRY
jgi:hypothetical protein